MDYPKYDNTIEDRHIKYMKINEKEYKVEILETTGADDYQNMMDMWISFGEGFLLLFAINDEESFQSIKSKYQRIKKGKHNTNVPIILVGNKQDLESYRKITYEEAKQLADEWGIEYIETSVKTGFNCIEPFKKLAQKIVEIKYSVRPDKKCKCNIY